MLSSRSPMVMLVRHKARINIQRPKLPHWNKAKFLAITKPQLPQTADLLSEHLNCYKAVEIKPPKEVNPLEVILGKKLLATCEQAQLIMFFHRNSVSSADVHKMWQTFKRNGFTYHKIFNNVIATHAFKDTRYAAVLQLCRSHTALVTCPEVKVAQLLRIQKKMPHIQLIGGVVQERFLSAPEIERFAELPGLDALRAQFSALLSRPAASVSSSLGHHQSALVRSLTAYTSAATGETEKEGS